MSLEVLSEDIISHFNTQWAGTTAIAWPNVDFDSQIVDEFVRITVAPSTSKQATLGLTSNMYRQFGSVYTQIFTKLNVGTDRSNQLADQVSAVWRSIRLNNIVFTAPNTVLVGNNDGFFQLNVVCDFYADTFI